MAEHSLAHGGLGVVTTHWGVTFTHFYLLVGVVKVKFSEYEIYLYDITFIMLNVRFLSLP